MTDLPCSSHHVRVRRVLTFLATAVMTLAAVSTAVAHDFWVIPDLFASTGDATLQVSGRSGTRFPAGSAVQPERVADAQLIGVSGRTRLTDLSVAGTALRIRQKPPAAGQYLVAVALTPRPTRSTPAGLMRFLRAEGGSAEAARLEREGIVTGDSIVFYGTSYASTHVQVGQGGPRAYQLTAGYLLDFVPVNDPAYLHQGDTLHVKLVGAGKAVPGIGLDAVPAADTAAGATAPTATPLTADANRIVHVPLPKAGPWMLRSAFVARRVGGAANEWDVARTTYVFNVSAHH